MFLKFFSLSLILSHIKSSVKPEVQGLASLHKSTHAVTSMWMNDQKGKVLYSKQLRAQSHKPW